VQARDSGSPQRSFVRRSDSGLTKILLWGAIALQDWRAMAPHRNGTTRTTKYAKMIQKQILFFSKRKTVTCGAKGRPINFRHRGKTATHRFFYGRSISFRFEGQGPRIEIATERNRTWHFYGLAPSRRTVLLLHTGALLQNKSFGTPEASCRKTKSVVSAASSSSWTASCC